MNLVKGLTKSLTAWGAIIAAAPAIDQVLSQMGLITSPALVPWIGATVTLIGAVTAIIGRIKAVAQIKGL